MKIKYLLMFALSLTLAACQNNEAPVQKAGSPAASAPQAVEPAMQKQVEEKVAQVAAAASNAVEVTKEAVATTAKSMQQQVSQANEKSAAVVEQLTSSAAAAKPKMEKPVATAPVVKPAAPAVVKPVAVKPAPMPVPVPVQPVAPAAAPAAAPAPAATGDVAKGQALSSKCKACHNFNDKKKVGPGLAGIYNRKAGAMADMSYSDALAAGTWNWDAAHLAAWVCDSKAAVKTFSGDASATTKMTSVRVCDAADQADLIAYLKTL